MDRSAQVLFIENADPVLADKIVWHQDPAYKALGQIDLGAPMLDMIAPGPEAARQANPGSAAFADAA